MGKKIGFYVKRNKIINASIIFILISFLGLVIGRIIGNDALMGISLICVCLFTLIFLALLLIFYFVRKSLISKVNKDNFKKILDIVNDKQDSDYIEIFMFGIWDYIQKSDLRKRVFYEKDYNNSEIVKKDLILISYLNCVTYRNNMVVSRVPKLVRPDSLSIEIINKYKEIEEQINQCDRTGLIKKLNDIEACYNDEREDAKENKKMMGSDAGIVEWFTIASNDSLGTNVIKFLLLALAVICFLWDWFKANQFTTSFFEITTIVLLLMDLLKDKDDKYLH